MSYNIGKPPDPLEIRVLRFIRNNKLLSDNDKLLVAVSGGPDSVCLLRLLAILRDRHGCKIGAAHVNYGLRATASALDQAFVEAVDRIRKALERELKESTD